jgi:hypothetical protein
VTREHAVYFGAAIIAAALIALAFAVAPRACEGGVEIYAASGCVALLMLLGLPFVTGIEHSTTVRIALSLGFAVLGAGAWLIGLFTANVRFICGMGYL